MRKLTRRQAQVDRAAQTFAHADSRAITRRRSIVEFAIQTVEDEITTLRASLVDAQKRKARYEAQVEGLTQTLEKR